MMRRLFVIALALALLGFFRPADAQAPSPDASAAAKELIDAMRAGEQFKMMVPMLLQQLKPAIVQDRKDVERDYDVLVPQMLAVFDARTNEFVAALAVVYATHFTADELRQLTAFYRGPVGQKFLAAMPRIMQDSMVVGQKIGEEVGAEAHRRMLDELRKRGHKL